MQAVLIQLHQNLVSFRVLLRLQSFIYRKQIQTAIQLFESLIVIDGSYTKISRSD